MKKITLYLLPVLFFTTFLHSQSHNHESHKTKTEPNEIYKKIKIANPTPELMNKLGRLGLDLDCGSQIDTDGNLLIELSTREESKVKTVTAYQVVVTDMEAFYAKRAVKDLPQAKTNLRTLKASAKNKSKNNARTTSLKSTTYGNITHRFENTEIDWTVPANFQLGASFGGCLTVDETNAQLDLMRSLYPNLITAKVNASPTDQRTIEGRPIYVVKISNSAITGSKPETLYTGMTHSREVSSLMNLTYYMWYLLENYATDPDVKNLVDHHDLYFIPIVNPDGLAYNQTQSPNGGGMQRKNRRETGACTTYLDGIDLNRNWGTYWGYDDEGSSPDGCDDTYRGTAGFSEAETSIIRDFFLLHNFKTSVNHHAYKNAALHGRAAFYRTNNLATNPGVPTGRENEYYQYSHDMTQFSRYAYGSSPNISYWNNGNCNDWMSEGSGKNTLCWTPENGAPTGEGGFWPTPTQITPIAKRAVRMNFIAAYYSGVYAKLHDLTKSDITSTSGTLNFGLERVGQTDGDFTLTVTPISSNILSVTNVAVQTGMTVLQQRNLDVNFTLSPTIANKEKIEFEVTLSNGSYIIYKTRIEKYYNPTSIFTSLANPTTLALAGWTASGTASWAITTTDGFGGTAGITTNTAASYANAITTANLTQTNAISLAGKQQVAIQFNAKWDLERSFDYVQLQGSPDGGTTWITMNGKYTKPGTTTSVTDYSTTLSTTSKTTADKGFQPDGQALYDGDKFDKWVLEEYYISATENAGLFNKASVKFRFILRTDSNNRNHGYNTTFKGFRFDNFKVLEIISSPPVAICKDATLSLNSSGSLTVLTTDVNNGSTDDIGITSISVSPNTFNCTHANTVQAVTLTVTDADGQTSTCTANVTINDVTPPVTPTLANVTAQCSVTPTAPTTTDTCAGTITGTTSTTFPITTQGTTIVTWSFNDGNGNTTTADQNIIIDDTVAPVTPTLANITGQCSVTPTAPTTTDACAGTITGTTPTVFPITTPGTTVITWTFNDGNGQSITANQNVIIESTTWNGATWSNGTPTASKAAIIAGPYSVAANITACTLTVNNNAVVTIPSGFNVTLTGAITVSSGSFTLNNNANLIQTTNAVNTGNIIVKRQTSALKYLDYVLWSSPVASQQLQSFSAQTLASRFYTYNPVTNLYNVVPTPAATNFTPTTGYLIRMPNNHPTTATIWEGQFQGVPNNGSFGIGITPNRYYATGNPYPSTIDADDFIGANSVIEALYFWRKTNNAATSSYATYTTAGGVANGGGGSSIIPNGIIQVGQGFIYKATLSNLIFNNGMRIGNNANQFLRTKAIEKNRIWLNLSKNSEPVNQMMVAYMTGATAGIDATIDGRYFNDNPTALTSLVENEEFVIQGRAIPFDYTDIVPLAFKAETAGNFEITIDHVDGLFSGNQDIILKDNNTGAETDLKTSSYSFSATAGTDNTRFALKYQKTLGIVNPELNDNNVTIYKSKAAIHIKSDAENIESIQLFDTKGSLLIEKNNINAKEFSIDTAKIANQVLIVKVTASSKKVISKKIVN
ncbi:M14 family zinc carboxypeptidase [Flavobacterium eburneipallidum]|uniref:M14 family zinc carboxypeptidase n=1 Tax=Flavobacterium eburneipallidum TaxID=3003263 RepID=UPI002482223A|nr:M14 family zinc carboxypeptidase [Flavobacterium eburneipallidum]